MITRTIELNDMDVLALKQALRDSIEMRRRDADTPKLSHNTRSKLHADQADASQRLYDKITRMV